MRKLILGEWISLDGYAADSNGKLDFFPWSKDNRYSDLDQLKFMESIDTILLGRRTYELFVDFWPEATTDKEIIADKLNGTSKVVFSNTMKEAPWGKWPNATVLSGDPVTEITKLKSNPGKDIILWGSLRLAHTLMNAKLIDEYHLNLCPTSVGGGTPAFPADKSYTQLNLLDSKRYDTGVLLLKYAP
jgi:dihydrofolate reductase